jgi:hypothetical protein
MKAAVGFRAPSVAERTSVEKVWMERANPVENLTTRKNIATINSASRDRGRVDASFAHSFA